MSTETAFLEAAPAGGLGVAVITSGAEALRAVQEFAASIADGVIERDRLGAVPERELAAFDSSGQLGITVPRKHHGAEDERYDLSRHWRNARTHASHDPVSWKYHHIGNYLLNDELPPNHGQI